MNENISALAQFLKDSAHKAVHQPSGNLPHQFVTPTASIVPGSDDQAPIAERSLTGHYLQMYDWDAYFFCQQAKALSLPDLPLAVLQNFLSFQKEDGYIPRTISPSSVWDEGDLCKPFLCQLASTHLSKTGKADLAFPVDEIINKLDLYLNYWVANRRHSSGLFHWRNVLESGVDNNLALLAPRQAAKNENTDLNNFIDTKLIACDLNCYLVNEFRAFAELTARFNHDDLTRKYHFRAKELQTLMEDMLWDEHLRMYTAFDPASGERIKIRSWTGLLPAIFGICEPARAEIVIEQNLKSEDHFFRKAGLASLAATEPLYNQAKRGLYGRLIVSNWQGPMWVLPNVLACRALTKLNQKDVAQKLASRVVDTLANALNQSGTLFENYNSETGQGLWAPQFASWNILALELIDLIN